MPEAIKVMFQGKAYYGFKKCPTWLKKKFKDAVGYKCEDCGLKEDDENTLEIHRPKRECDGGLYMCVPKNHPLNNSKVLCNKDHKKYNYSPRVGGY